MAKIGEKILEDIKETIGDALVGLQSDIDEAYLKMGDQPFAVSIGIKFEAADGGTKYKMKLSFPSGAKIETEMENVIDDDQIAMEFGGGERTETHVEETEGDV